MNGPAGSGLAFTALLALLACPYAACRAFTALRKTTRRTGPPPGAGAVKNPVPGGAAPPRRVPEGPAANPVRPSPAPGHGGLAKRIDVYADGRTEITDHRRRTREVIPGYCPHCAAAVDWDRELKRITP